MYPFEFLFLSSLDIYPGVELLDHMVAIFLVFCKTSILFFMAAAPIYIPNKSVAFLHIPANTYYLLSF